MKKILLFLFAITLALSLVTPANAIIIQSYDWYNGDAVMATVTETFTSAAELGGSENLFEYSVENKSANDYISLFRVANPDNLSRTMIAPTGWGERTGVQNFLWETFDTNDFINPGATLGGFQLYAEGVRDVLTSPPLAYNNRGWIMFGEIGVNRIDIYGEVSGPRSGTAAVPEPATMLLLGSGLLGLTAFRRKLGK